MRFISLRRVIDYLYFNPSVSREFKINAMLAGVTARKSHLRVI